MVNYTWKVLSLFYGARYSKTSVGRQDVAKEA